jgi:NAD(P)-dependent dehydrogenase (short-subunit alcohol dehydrogenase family)
MDGEVIFHVAIIFILTNYCFDIISAPDTNFKRNGQDMNTSSHPVALVTGASSGIGYASALALAKAGYRVFGTSRKPMATPPRGVTMLVADVTDDGSVDRLIADVMAAAGRIDLLVNNAGYAVSGAAEESSIAQVQALFDTNFHGVVRVTNTVLPDHAGARRGADPEHRLGRRADPRAVRRLLRGQQARHRRLFGIARPRGAPLRHPRRQ